MKPSTNTGALHNVGKVIDDTENCRRVGRESGPSDSSALHAPHGPSRPLMAPEGPWSQRDSITSREGAIGVDADVSMEP